MAMLYTIASGIICLCIGLIIGGRSEAAYWRDHEKDGSTIHSGGKFYVVVSEHDYVQRIIQ